MRCLTRWSADARVSVGCVVQWPASASKSGLLQERVGEVCKDLAQWLEQLAMLLSLSAQPCVA